MKKIILTAIAAAVLSSGIAQAASTGTITFNGELTANTCDVVVNGGTADATVILPTISVGQFAANGATAGTTSFNLGLENCTGSLQTASAYFEAGGSVDVVTGRVKNTGSAGRAVSLQLRDGSSSTQSVIKAGDTSQVNGNSYVAMSGGKVNLPYSVEYYADDFANIDAGTVAGSVVYSIQYK